MRPLRIAALAILGLGSAMTTWLLLGPWLPIDGAPVRDAYYVAAKLRHDLPYAVGGAVVALVVFVALHTTRSHGRWASAGLWLILLGATGLLAFTAVEIGFDSPPEPRHYVDLVHGGLAQVRLQTQLMLLASLTIVVGLVGGMLMWVLAYRLDRPRPR